MHHPTDRITHTTAFITSVVEHWLEREIAQHRVKDHSDTEKENLLPENLMGYSLLINSMGSFIFNIP